LEIMYAELGIPPLMAVKLISRLYFIWEDR
jgi:hypothetical protein